MVGAMSSPPAGIDRLSRGPTHSLMVWSSVIVLRWHQNATVDTFRPLSQKTRDYIARNVGKFALLAIADEQVAPPPEDVRKLSSEDLMRYGDRVYATGLVALSSGFTAAALRAAISTVLTFTRTTYPSKIFGTEAECAAWLAPLASRELRNLGNKGRPPEAVTPTTMLEFFEATRAGSSV